MGENTVPYVPLDLTNKTKARVSGTQRAAGSSKQSTVRQVDPPHGGNDRHRIQHNAGSARWSNPNQSQPAAPGVNGINQVVKPAVALFSNLPIRKRPVPSVRCSRDELKKEEGPFREPKVVKDSERSRSGTGETEIVHVQRLIEPQCVLPSGQYRNVSIVQWPQKILPGLPNDPIIPSSSPDCAQQLWSEIAAATHQDEDGDTPLHIAVAKENAALVTWMTEMFQQAHKDVNIFNNLRQTPLHLAVITHQLSMVSALMKAGADPGALDRNGQTALHLCCEHGDANCLSEILQHYTYNRSPHLEIRNYEGLTPFHLAVRSGDRKLARVLLDSGAKINAGDDKSGRSPLIHAVENNSIDMVNMLIENECDINAQSYSGNTALHSACGRGHIDIARVLLKNGADSSLKNNHNDTAVMVAKNKKVSDVLRGKGTRGLKSISPSNGSLSPGNPIHHNGSLSPTPSVLHSPQHHFTNNIISEHLSSGESMESLKPMANHNSALDNRVCYGAHNYFSYVSQLGYNQLNVFQSSIQGGTVISVPIYCSSGLQRTPLYSDAQMFVLPGTMALTYGSVSHGTICQSRPSSRSSNQSDTSIGSVNGEERAVT